MEDVKGILEQVSKNGIFVDIGSLKKLNDSLTFEISELQKEIPFKPTSNKELGNYIEKVMNIKLSRRGKTGPSVAKEVIEPIIEETKNPILMAVMKSKSKTKLLGMVTRLLLDSVVFDSKGDLGKVHTHFTYDCSSGRIYTESPSLQLMPLECRERIIPAPGNTFINLDYKQEELRILAVASGDEKLVNSLKNGEDLHVTVVKELFGNDVEITPELRMVGKVINYGLIYGMSADGLASELKISVQQATDYLDMYFKKFSGVQSFIRSSCEEALKLGYTETLISKTRYSMVPDSFDSEKELRRAFNHIIQGTAADILKNLIIALDKKGFTPYLRMLTHDAILIECPEENRDLYIVEIKDIMKEVGKEFLQDVDVKFGKTWREAMGK